METSWGRVGRWPSYQAAHPSARGHGARPVQTPTGKSTKPRSTVVLSLTRQGLLKIVTVVWTLLLTWRTVCTMSVITMVTVDQSVMLWESTSLPVKAKESPSAPGEQKPSVVSLRLWFYVIVSFFVRSQITKFQNISPIFDLVPISLFSSYPTAMVCPANSHYTLCATGCTATCASLPTLSACRRACTETCECDEGYLLSGDTCVPVRDCGCSYDGHYYKKGEVFYPEKECVARCTCGENGAVSCQNTQCRKGETCKLVNGVKGCHPEGQGKCVASGDPHYTSFDGRRFDFQGTCVYVLAKVCDDDNGQLTPFSVTQGNEKYGNGKVAVTKSVAVTAYGYVIYIQQKMPWKVVVSSTTLSKTCLILLLHLYLFPHNDSVLLHLLRQGE